MTIDEVINEMAMKTLAAAKALQKDMSAGGEPCSLEDAIDGTLEMYKEAIEEKVKTLIERGI